VAESARATSPPNPFAPLSQTERAEAETIRLAVPPDDWTPQVPAPEGMTPPLNPRFGQMGQANRSWVYRTEAGEIAFAVFRFDYENAKGEPAKDTIPMTYGTKNGRLGWNWKAPPAPSVLYRAPELIEDTTKPVLVVEGEKTADAAAKLFPERAVVTWQGGGNAVHKADWRHLTGRSVIIWPDNDKPGRKAAEKVGRIAHEIAATDVRIVPVPETWPEGWDLADDPPGDATVDTLRVMLAGAEEATQAAEMPGGYSVNAKGVWFSPPIDKETDGQPEPIFISAPFEVIAETKDEAGSSWGLLLRWQDRDKQEHQWAMPRKLLHVDGNAIASELEDAGLSVATGKRPHDLLKSLLSRVETPRRMRCVNRSGWHQTERGRVYVLPGGEAFGPGSSGVILQTEKAAAGGGGSLQVRGTLADWQENVGKLAVGNDRVALFICAALAAPLLYIASEPSGGLHIHGKSQDGKTTTLGVAASVWGKGDSSGQIRSWRATANGFEGIASETCDALLPLDEIGQADPREVGEVVYMLSNEAGKGRAARDGSARARRTWRTLFLSTGEVPLATKMQEKGNKPMAGQDVRLVSLPANAGGKYGVFQELHDHKSAVAFATHLREASRAYYGTASRTFLSELTWALAVDQEGIASFLADQRTEFEKANVPNGSDGQVSSVARRFALLGAAGELAIAFKVLPWPKGEAIRAAKACFVAWLAARGGTGAGEDNEAIAVVRNFIEMHDESRFTTVGHEGQRQGQSMDGDEVAGGRATINRVGFRRRGADGWEYLILPEAWKKEVCKGLDPVRAANVLKDAGFLVPGEGRHLMPKVSIAGYGRLRMYQVKSSILSGADE